MAGQTNVDIPGMRAAMPHFEQGLTETHQAYTAVENQLNALGSHWTGDAAEAFKKAMGQWLENCDTVHAALDVVFQKLQDTAGKYENVHSQTNDAAASLQSAMSAGLPI